MTVADSIMTAHNRNAAQLELDGICNLTKRCLGYANWERGVPIVHSPTPKARGLYACTYHSCVRGRPP